VAPAPLLELGAEVADRGRGRRAPHERPGHGHGFQDARHPGPAPGQRGGTPWTARRDQGPPLRHVGTRRDRDRPERRIRADAPSSAGRRGAAARGEALVASLGAAPTRAGTHVRGRRRRAGDEGARRREIRRLIDECYVQAVDTLRASRARLDRLPHAPPSS